MSTQTIALPDAASPQVIGMMKQAAQRGEIHCYADDEEDDPGEEETKEIEVSDDCFDGDHNDCTDGSCECPCHEVDSDDDLEDSDCDDDDDDALDEDADDDLESDSDFEEDED